VRSRACEWIPFRMWIPAIPQIADGPLPLDEIRTRQEIPITGLRTVVCTTERATREAQEMIQACRARVERGESWAVTELLDANPAFIADPWVRHTLGEMVEQRRPLRRRGRIRGKYQFHPLVVVGLVEYFLEHGAVKSIEQVFHRLEELKILAYDAAKELYYRTRREDRFRPILMEFPELSRRLSAEETAALVARVEMLGPGSRITRTFHDPRLGTVGATFEAA